MKNSSKELIEKIWQEYNKLRSESMKKNVTLG